MLRVTVVGFHWSRKTIMFQGSGNSKFSQHLTVFQGSWNSIFSRQNYVTKHPCFVSPKEDSDMDNKYKQVEDITKVLCLNIWLQSFSLKIVSVCKVIILISPCWVCFYTVFLNFCFWFLFFFFFVESFVLSVSEANGLCS